MEKFQLRVESPPEGLEWFCFTSYYDWSRKLTPSSQPVRYSTETSRSLVPHVSRLSVFTFMLTSAPCKISFTSNQSLSCFNLDWNVPLNGEVFEHIESATTYWKWNITCLHETSVRFLTSNLFALMSFNRKNSCPRHIFQKCHEKAPHCYWLIPKWLSRLKTTLYANWSCAGSMCGSNMPKLLAQFLYMLILCLFNPLYFST